MNMNIFDLVSNVYDADLLVAVQDFESLEKGCGPVDNEEEEYFKRFIRIISSV